MTPFLFFSEDPSYPITRSLLDPSPFFSLAFPFERSAVGERREGLPAQASPPPASQPPAVLSFSKETGEAAEILSLGDSQVFLPPGGRWASTSHGNITHAVASSSHSPVGSILLSLPFHR